MGNRHRPFYAPEWLEGVYAANAAALEAHDRTLQALERLVVALRTGFLSAAVDAARVIDVAEQRAALEDATARCRRWREGHAANLHQAEAIAAAARANGQTVT